MKSSAKNIKLASVDDLFSTEESRAAENLEKVMEIPLTELHAFKNHPFKVRDDEAMMETADSIRQYGVLVPAIARPNPNGGYELIAGHRRHRASELAEKETMPVIVRDLDDANSHFPRPAGPHFPASQGHIKRPVLEISRVERVPPC